MTDRIELERKLLACLLLDPSIISECREMVVEDDFTGRRRVIYRAIVSEEPANRSNEADFAWKLRIATDSGMEFADLAKLSDAMASAAPWRALAKELSRERRVRAIADIFRRCLDAAGSGTDEGIDEAAMIASDNLLAEVARGTERAIPIATMMQDVLHELEKRRDPAYDHGAKTGLADLDEHLGGIEAGQLAIFAARPGAGKTSFLVQIALVAAAGGRRVFFSTLEMSTFQIILRMLCNIARVSYKAMAKGYYTNQQADRIVEAGERFLGYSIAIDEKPGTVAALRTRALRAKAQIAFVDYLGLVSADSPRENRNEQVARIGRALKWMSKELGIPVIAASQLSRPQKGSEHKAPRLSDLRDSGSLEADADIVVFLHVDEDSPKERHMLIAKHRNGPTGFVRVAWDGESMRFANITTRQAP